MDAGTIAALVALVLAILALLVSFAQVLQQYFSTGELIRLCDDVVFGAIPGQGRRFWEVSQFRFRVLYTLPQIQLPVWFWEGSTGMRPSCSTGGDKLEALDPRKRNPGEASWASFCSVMTATCANLVNYQVVVGDADRCPADLPTIPMPVSMRDIAVIGLMNGMDCTYASFKRTTLSMQGAVGTLTTSRHPILGPILHFQPRQMSPIDLSLISASYAPLSEDVCETWKCRMWDFVTVANRVFSLRERREAERLNGKWISRFRSAANAEQGAIWPGLKSRTGREARTEFLDPSISRAQNDSRRTSNLSTESVRVADATFGIRRGIHDGDWSLHYEKGQTRKGSMESRNTLGMNDDLKRRDKYSIRRTADSQNGFQPPSSNYKSATVDDAELSEGHSDSRLKQVKHACMLQSKRTQRVLEAVKDAKIVDEMVKDGRLSRGSPSMFMITEKGEPMDFEESVDEKAARNREEERAELRKRHEDARTARLNRQAANINSYGSVNWYWLSQMDIIGGFWATYWQKNFNQHECLGAINVVLECLLGLVEPDFIQYADEAMRTFPNSRHACLSGQWRTFPGYAINAQGGVVSPGIYRAVHMSAFANPVPTLNLYGSHDVQVSRESDKSAHGCRLNILELMGIDSWLSMVSRTPEISEGRNVLLKQTPAMVRILLEEFALDFTNVHFSVNEGGLEDIQGLTENVLDMLADEELSNAEMIYVLVAVLRTVKVAKCIISGVDTEPLEETLMNDVQAHLV